MNNEETNKFIEQLGNIQDLNEKENYIKNIKRKLLKKREEFLEIISFMTFDIILFDNTLNKIIIEKQDKEMKDLLNQAADLYEKYPTDPDVKKTYNEIASIMFEPNK